MNVDLVIIGAGVGGLSAAATAASHGIDTIVIEHLAPGGQVSTVENIRNFPGFPEGIAGFELGPMLQEQAEGSGARFLLDTVNGIERSGPGLLVRTATTEIVARSVVIATGSTRKSLDVPGEAEFEGRGVSHCAACDGHFFRGQTVVVAGGGDSAFDEADALAGMVRDIVIVHRGAEPVAQQEARARIAAHGNIRVLANAEISRISGDTGVTSVEVNSDGEVSKIECGGVFVYVGLDPNSALVADLAELDDQGRVMTDEALQTRTPGLFAVGDVRHGGVCLLSAVAGDGAAAAASVIRFLEQ